ncbi:hypothetical protein [Streptomyces sp. NPDC001536]|uniref:hypothetical protein n=1 Tax=Streptomyces sp. NPDC001536 TaxID=3364583 RepID=UPI0036AC4841
MTVTDEEAPPPLSAQCSATCQTSEPECPNYGIPYETTVYELPDGSLSDVICGVCEQTITQVVRVVQEAET